jgi:hypothetical protein
MRGQEMGNVSPNPGSRKGTPTEKGTNKGEVKKDKKSISSVGATVCKKAIELIEADVIS